MKLKRIGGFSLACALALAMNSTPGATFAQGTQRVPTVTEYMQQGSAFYLKHDFKNAIGPYSRALELEKRQRGLSNALWHVLVDNLGMSYGITGDLKKAKETFEYGLSADDKYPLFYYNLACTYAELNDLDTTIAQLKKAFQYRQNVLPGESMPDPGTDDSFQRFMRDQRFVAALNDLKHVGGGSAAQTPSPDHLVITERADGYEVMVPVSRVSLAIPKGQLVPSKPTVESGNPRYFSLEGRGRPLMISGWFEPEQAFSGIDSFWAGEQRSLTQNGIQLQNISRERIGNWQVILYDIRMPSERNFNMRAEWVGNGTWIDLHLSVTSDQPETEAQKTLRDALSAIRVNDSGNK